MGPWDVSVYPDNVKLREEFESAHPDIEIIPPSRTGTIEWIARWRDAARVPAGEPQVICTAYDLGILLGMLRRRLG